MSDNAACLDVGVADLAARIRRREISPLDVVDAHIARIERVNGAINALVAQRFDEARQDALRAEARLLSAPVGAPFPPLLGVPCTVQEALGVAGLPQTGGSAWRWGAVAGEDGGVARRLRAAGAIPLGVTNLSEGGLWLETNNLLYGRTLNPWGEGRTAGGAGGGEAALIAAGGSPFGAAAGLSGAVQVPAAFCGVPAHQPTGGLLPAAYGWPDLPRAGCGLLARRVPDLELLLALLADQRLPPVDLREVELYPILGLDPARTAPALADAVDRAADALLARGARRGAAALPSFAPAADLWVALASEALGEDYPHALGAGRRIPLWKEALRFPFGRSNHTSAALLVLLAEAGRRLVGRVSEGPAAALALRDSLEDALGDRGVLLLPAYTRPAPRHRGTLLTPADFLLSGLFSALEMPATVVPVGFDTAGLPLAVQLIARRGGDHLTLDAAAALEADLGGWVRAQPHGL